MKFNLQMFVFKLCSILVILILFVNIQPVKSVKHTRRIKTGGDLIADPDYVLKSIDKYVTKKRHGLEQLELLSEFWRSMSIESSQDAGHYVRNPLNCLKVLAALVVDLDLLVRGAVDLVNTRLKIQDQVVAVSAADLDRAGTRLAASVLEREIPWERFVMSQDRMDSEDKIEFLKLLARTGLMSIHKSHELTNRILYST